MRHTFLILFALLFTLAPASCGVPSDDEVVGVASQEMRIGLSSCQINGGVFTTCSTACVCDGATGYWRCLSHPTMCLMWWETCNTIGYHDYPEGPCDP